MRKDSAKEDYLRTLGVRLFRIPSAMVLEHTDEFVREVMEAMRLSAEKAGK
jgi:very-short-patch-repair endonuclease